MPVTQDPIRWGISSTGSIAGQFVDDLRRLADANIVAVGSRSAERAAEFAARHDIGTAHASRDELAANPDVDVVYVASPQSAHCDDTVRFLEAGKHVLCEKPFALNKAQAERMFDAARAHDRFVMEAIWSRFLPGYVRLGELLAERVIGPPELVEATFGFAAPRNTDHRLFDRALGGGALLDLGIYPLQLATLVLGPIHAAVATGVVGGTGVDETISIQATHDDGTVSRLAASIRAVLPNRASISGNDGIIEFGPPMHNPRKLVVTTSSGTDEIDTPFDGNGLRFQAVEVHRCVRAGLLESPTMPWAETLRLAATMDALRAQVGVAYDADE